MLLDLDNLNSRSSNENKKSLHFCSDHYKACEKSHAIAIITEWDEFKTYDWEKIYTNLMKPANVFDGRNILDKEVLEKIGFKVHLLGKN